MGQWPASQQAIQAISRPANQPANQPASQPASQPGGSFIILQPQESFDPPTEPARSLSLSDSIWPCLPPSVYAWLPPFLSPSLPLSVYCNVCVDIKHSTYIALTTMFICPCLFLAGCSEPACLLPGLAVPGSLAEVSKRSSS